MQNTFKTVQARYTILKALLDFQFKALGFRTCGKQVGDVFDGYETAVKFDGYKTVLRSDGSGYVTYSTTKKPHIEKYAYYKRHSAYPKNALLDFTGFLLSALRMIRKWAVVSLPFSFFWACYDSERPMIYIFFLYCLSWLVTIGLASLATAIRKAFRMDERTDEICLRNGWQLYSNCYNS